MKTIAIAIAALAASVVSAQAESFTVSGSSEMTNRVGGKVAGGHEMEATFSTGKENTVYASGKKSSGTFNCAQWPAEAGHMYQSVGLCTVEEGGGDKFTVSYVCQVLEAKSNSADCWGRLTGTGGSYAKKVGQATWRGVDSADRKSGTFSGTGMWN